MTSFGWENRAEFDQHVTRRMGMRGTHLHQGSTEETMKGRPHFVESDEPIVGIRQLTSICGATIEDAYLAFEWDVAMMGKIILREDKICHKCLKAVSLRLTPGKKYLYGAINSSEVKRNGDDE